MSLTYGFCLDELSSMYNSDQFSDAFHAVIGDGITLDGTKLSVTVIGFTATVGSGYAMAAGRWLKNDEQLTLSIQPSSNSDDRTDALVVRVDYATHKAVLEILVDVDAESLPDSLRNSEGYGIVLCIIRVPRGASSLTPENVTDVRFDPALCGTVVPLSAISGDVLYVYNFLKSSMGWKIEHLLSLQNAASKKADDEILSLFNYLDSKFVEIKGSTNESISNLQEAIKKTGGGATIGDLQTARLQPGKDWLLCDGGPVPGAYPALSALIGATLPNISRPEDRYRTYIYAEASA